MACLDFIEKIHRSTPRNYLDRVLRVNKADCALIAKQFGKDYWDGDRHYGYGGYTYDGRWRPVAQAMAQHYGLKAGDRILDVGCGKGYLLYEFTQVVPGVEIVGLDVSEYAVENAKEEVKPFLRVGTAVQLPFPDHSFDFVISINTLHNLYIYDLFKAIQEIQRVGKSKRYVLMDSYRNEQEKVNLMYWQITCEIFFTPKESEWFLQMSGYSGDHGFVFFE